jgi:Secretion system C-terminal sorting domain
MAELVVLNDLRRETKNYLYFRAVHNTTMKKLLYIITTVCALTTAQGQQFSFQMFFTDAVGNQDSITLGYDSLATDSVDIAFGETNIFTSPISTGLDVRITNEWRNRDWYNMPGTYHIKKQIVFYDCLGFRSVSSIDIHTKHWPVTATWDKSLFTDVCTNGSLFTSLAPGGWWDVFGPSNLGIQTLSESNSVQFTSNISDYGSHSYINGLDTIPVFWQAIADMYIIAVNQISSPDSQLTVFPNPATDDFSIHIPQNFGTVKHIQLFSPLGQLVMTSQKANDINISQLEKGVYLILIANEKGVIQWARVVKS